MNNYNIIETMKKTLLDKAFKEKSLIGIRTSSLAWGESIIGFIVELEESFFTINEIDEYGLLIGNTTIVIEDVANVVINDRYQRRLKYIHDNRSLLNPNNRVTIWKEGAELISSFKTLVKTQKITTFYFNEDDYVIGVILEFDESYLMIKNIGSEGDEDGLSCYPINKLVGLRYDGIEEQKIKLLFEASSEFYQ